VVRPQGISQSKRRDEFLGMRPSIGICVLLLGVCLGVTPIHAQDATWLAMPGDGNFNNAANWDPATVPTGTAFFGISNIADLTFSVDTTVGGWTFDPGAPAYSFTNDRVLTFNGAGIAINGGSAAITNNGGLQFLNGSSAGSAEIANMAGANLVFANSSSAGNASITNKGAATTLFSDSSSAGNATIVNEANGTIAFAQNSDGGLAKIINEGTVDFRGADRSIKVGSLAGGRQVSSRQHADRGRQQSLDRGERRDLVGTEPPTRHRLDQDRHRHTDPIRHQHLPRHDGDPGRSAHRQRFDRQFGRYR
jgi:hypothetical protein